MMIHWIWLATRPDLHDRDKMALLEHFDDPEDIFYAEKEAFQGIECITSQGLQALMDKDLHPAGKIIRECMDKNIHICTFHDAAYPGRLKNIPDPPMVLYYKGFLPDMDSVPVITVVGTRSASTYGITTGRKFGGQIARCGGLIVSGMAKGIDGAAVAGALTAGGNVVGVLGCGVDIVYPKCNRSLFADTERYGCLISEFPPGTPPYKWNFPKRNRIMSGLANGVLIVEAPQVSGALITARRAAEQGRDVFVVPGNVDVPTCVGSNELLREGGIAVRNGWDVVSEYLSLYPEAIHMDSQEKPSELRGPIEKELPKVAQKPRSPENNQASDSKKVKKPIDNPKKPPYSDIQDKLSGLTENEQAVAKLLQDGECLVDDLISRAEIPAGAVLSALTMLEIKGVVSKLPGNRAALK